TPSADSGCAAAVPEDGSTTPGGCGLAARFKRSIRHLILFCPIPGVLKSCSNGAFSNSRNDFPINAIGDERSVGNAQNARDLSSRSRPASVSSLLRTSSKLETKRYSSTTDDRFIFIVDAPTCCSAVPRCQGGAL